ncbi:MAG: cupredoxin domain-containing protein [Candidatus Acidiferrales bacterium]
MKKIAKSLPLSIVSESLLGLAILLSMPTWVGAQNRDTQIIEITAKKYEYSISPVHVKIGARIQLKITATDHDHGFKISAFPDGAAPNGTPGLIFSSAQDCWQLKKGETAIIEFLAQAPGTYTFKCCHFCGRGHKGMKGQIIVDQ